MMLIWSMSIYFLPFVTLFIDDEFESALARAEQVEIDTEPIHEKPFDFISRARATQRYNQTAIYKDMPIYSDDICVFNDIQWLADQLLKDIILACRYRFFWWSQWWFAPDALLTKSSSLVAISKGLYPREDFIGMLPYREPFVERAKELGITKYHSTEFLERPITHYELLLQLYRLGQLSS